MNVVKNFIFNFRNFSFLRKFFYNGEMFIDQDLEKFLNYDNGFFVELGANDGVNQSNSLFFEKFRNWKGVLVEPSPNNYINCLKVRSAETRVFCNACVSFEFNDKYVDMVYDNLMTIGANLDREYSLPSQDFVMSSRPGRKQNIRYRYGAVPATLDSILTFAQAPKNIDFLSLDVEGAELDVLKGINHDKYRFKYILIESINFEKLRKYIEPLNYRYVTTINNYNFLFCDTRDDD